MAQTYDMPPQNVDDELPDSSIKGPLRPVYDEYDLALIDTFKGEGNTAPEVISEIESIVR
jgi:hypothetical protein